LVLNAHARKAMRGKGLIFVLSRVRLFEPGGGLGEQRIGGLR
jgi:hypothetical protein